MLYLSFFLLDLALSSYVNKAVVHKRDKKKAKKHENTGPKKTLIGPDTEPWVNRN